jgi:hypothetical protein
MGPTAGSTLRFACRHDRRGATVANRTSLIMEEGPMSTTTRRYVAVAAMAAVAALGLAGCGGDDADGDADAETVADEGTTDDKGTSDDEDGTSDDEGTSDDNPWSVTGGMLNGSVGDTFDHDCPAGGSLDWAIWGGDDGQYTDDSSICVAAVHAGLITAEDGGMVVVELTPGLETYGDGFEANGVTSTAWTVPWTGSFTFPDA